MRLICAHFKVYPVPSRNKNAFIGESLKDETPIRTSLSPHAGDRRDVEGLRRDAWRDFGAVTVPVDDERLTASEAATLRGIGLRLFGPRASR